MRATHTNISRTWTDVVDRVLGYTGLFIIGAMAWACDRAGYGPVSASRPSVHAIPQRVAR
ncbi:MAG TPA: hypothetical protein VLG10_09740 [Methylomirabilota bacterium]|nr:hypothetical protein [Solirubrobacterales bacterium]HSF06056.1 hypothetical protein [Methylomirabilota bacterium]